MAVSDTVPAPKASRRKITVTNLGKRYGSVRAIADVSFSVAKGEFCCVVGPSGCGKTTLLRTIAGLEEPDSGSVLIDGEPITEPGLDRGMVFQENALFPWRTVRGNIRFGLDRPTCDCPDCETRVRALLDLVGLEEFADAYPKELSGGMKQRVAVARALAVDPDVLLLDEPFASLDAQTRDRLHSELLDIWTRTEKTVVFVTHDIDEAVKLADRIVVMETTPGTVRSSHTIDLSRPRDRTARPFIESVGHIRDELASQPEHDR